jgi:hypothetical protein
MPVRFLVVTLFLAGTAASAFDAPAALKSARKAAAEDRTPAPPSGPVFSMAGVGFNAGNEYDATPLYGEVSVTCYDNGRTEHASFRCRDEILEPYDHVRFVGPEGVDADKVELEARWENGKTRKKKKGYDAAGRRSTGYFNLWIATLLQRPLLDYGRNAIHFVMKKDGRRVAEGDFVATVNKAPRRVCRYRRHYTSHNASDCRGGSSVCRQLFRDENYCR